MVFTTEHRKRSALHAHRHPESYVSLVLKGTYSEQSVDGNYLLEAGTIVYHPAHHRHANTFENSSALVLNLGVELTPDLPYAAASVPRLARYLERMMTKRSSTLKATLEELFGSSTTKPKLTPTWMQGLAGSLRDTTNHQSIHDICQGLDISPEHACREYRRHFGVSPGEYRREFRLRSACDALSAGVSPSAAAQQAGFADQSHLGRVMKNALGKTPATYPCK